MHITKIMLTHMLAVARESYILAKRYGLNEEECRNAFTLGFVHNIGYEFTDVPENHRIVGYEMLANLTNVNTIKEHGLTQIQQTSDDVMLKIINSADLNINADGSFIGPKGRLKDIETRYGAASTKYRNTRQMAELLGMSIK